MAITTAIMVLGTMELIRSARIIGTAGVMIIWLIVVMGRLLMMTAAIHALMGMGSRGQPRNQQRAGRGVRIIRIW